MIIFGWRKFGTIWKTKRGYWIGTTFFHIMFIPLFPIESFIVTKNGFWRFSGVKIPLHKMSKRIAYLRGVLTLGCYCVFPKLALLYEKDAAVSGLTPAEVQFINILFFISIPSLLALITTYLSPRVRQATAEYGESMESFIDSLNAPNPAFNSDPAAAI